MDILYMLKGEKLRASTKHSHSRIMLIIHIYGLATYTGNDNKDTMLSINPTAPPQSSVCWTEILYNLCNEAPAKFCTSPTIPVSAFAKPWMGGGRGPTGSPGLSQALGVGIGL
jgi:hypothetical protein